MTASSFPDFITARRRELDLTLGDVASELGVSPITVSNWSNGDSRPNPENLAALADLLEVPADELAEMAGVKLATPDVAVNLMPKADQEPVPDEPLTDEIDMEEPVAAVLISDSVPTAEEAAGSPAEPAEAEAATTDLEADEVPIPAPDVEPPEAMDQGEPAVDETPDEIPDVAVPIPAIDDEAVPAAAAVAEAAPPEAPIDEPPVGAPSSGEPDAVPAFLAATPETEPAAKRRPSLRRPSRAPADETGPVAVLPLTYIEDPKQLMRYRIRWILTAVVLAIMFFVLLWASRELLSALSEVKQAVTPGGIGG
jgi:transcriptional regulator with XRE-family HTH domain